ncbi:hypothetical protein ACLGI4_03000 [Streptomyces sp. HMX112]|uniref:hypothetical protein n=1 Tax=Streptomyces sp. HMX112 TaxID=3390850 RepID=UPI003A8107C6
MAKPIRRMLAIAVLTAAAVVPMTATAHAAPSTAYTCDDRGRHDCSKYYDKDGKHKKDRWSYDCGCDDDKSYGKGGYDKKGSCYGGGLFDGFPF